MPDIYSKRFVVRQPVLEEPGFPGEGYIIGQALMDFVRANEKSFHASEGRDTVIMFAVRIRKHEAQSYGLEEVEYSFSAFKPKLVEIPLDLLVFRGLVEAPRI